MDSALVIWLEIKWAQAITEIWHWELMYYGDGNFGKLTNIYIYIYIYMFVCVCVCVQLDVT
jgi:hypothetical protein